MGPINLSTLVKVLLLILATEISAEETSEPTSTDTLAPLATCYLPTELRSLVFGIKPGKEEYNAGDEITITCHSDDQILSGTSTVTCKEDGSWSDFEPPACRDKGCDDLEAPSNGMVAIVMENDHAVANYSCNEGYSLQPSVSASILCLNNEWVNTPPVCLAECPPLENPEGGSFTFDCLHMSCEAQLSCADDLVAYPFRTFTCEGENGWLPANVTLQCITKDTLGAFAEVSIPSDEVSTQKPSLAPTETSAEEPSTQQLGLDCPIPAKFPNGKFHTFQGIIYYQCQFMYLMVGKPVQYCRMSGKWTGKMPQCFHVTDPSVDFSTLELMQYWQEIFRIYPHWIGDYTMINLTVPTSLMAKHHAHHSTDFLLEDKVAKVHLRAKPVKDHLAFNVISVDVESALFTHSTNWTFDAVLTKRRGNWTLKADWFTGKVTGFEELVLHPAPRQGSLVKPVKDRSQEEGGIPGAEFAKAMGLGVFFGGLAIVVAAVAAYMVVRRYRPFSSMNHPRVAGFENPVYNQQIL